MFGDPRVIDLRNRLTLSETAWVLRHSDLAIGNDCGTMHIADAVRTPPIVIFGPTCEVKNGPVNRSVLIRLDLPCAPCQYGEQLSTCDDPVCMNGISPDIVLKQTRELLGAAGAHKKSRQIDRIPE